MGKATIHMGKQGTTKHNDRNFNLDKAKHINQEMTQHNKYIFLQGNGKYNEMSFEEMEIDYYREHYGEALEEQNEKARAKRQKDRIKDIEYWVKHDKQKRPDEMILQIGNKKEHYDGQTLMKCIYDFCKKVNEKYGTNFHMLNLALHEDEATPHIHIRGVFDYEKDGIRRIGTDKALESLGIQPPKPHEKIGRFNNRKQTFTEEIRSIWYEVIRSHGIQIDEEVKNPSQKHLETLEYKCQQLEKDIEQKDRELAKKDKKLQKAMKLLEEAEKKDIELLGYSTITPHLNEYRKYKEER